MSAACSLVSAAFAVYFIIPPLQDNFS